MPRFICWHKHSMASAAEQDTAKDSKKTQMSSDSHFQEEDDCRAHYVVLLSRPVQPGSSVKVKWQDCKFSLTAQAPLRETKWHQPVVVTHCCWQGDDEHLSLKGKSYRLFLSESMLWPLCQKENDQGRKSPAFARVYTSSWCALEYSMQSF